MIIQCQKCLTKFRFDDALMAGEGVWVRCSRCQQVFFEENPSDQKAGDTGRPIPVARATTLIPTPNPTKETGHPEESLPPKLTETGAPEPAQVLSEAASLQGEREALPLAKENGWEDASPKPPLPAAMGIGPEETTFEKDIEAMEALMSEDQPVPTEPEAWEIGEETEAMIPKPTHRKGRGLLWVLIVILILILGVGAFFWLYPAEGRRAVNSAAFGLGSLTDLIQGKAKKEQGIDLKTIKFENVRQRSVNNWVIGELRIVEGTVVNRSKNAVTEIQVKAKLYSADGMVLAETVSFCGNLLTDEELGALAEPEIQRELSQPRGSDASNDKIEPGGQIPFMVIFARAPAGVAKTTVVVSGAERLLP